MDNSLPTLIFVFIKLVRRAPDNSLESRMLSECTSFSRVRRGPVVHVSCGRDPFREDPLEQSAIHMEQ